MTISKVAISASLFLAMLTLAAPLAHAQATGAPADACAGGAGTGFDAQVAACTALIDAPTTGPELRARAHDRRAFARWRKGYAIERDPATGAPVDPVLADLDVALQLKPDYFEARLLRSQLRFNETDYDGALADYANLTLLKPEDPRVWSGRALVRAVADRDLDAALTDAERALKLDAGSVPAHFSRALVWYRKGQNQKAIADFDAAAALPSAIYGRALAESRLGRQAQGDADLQKAVAAEPGVAAQFARWKIQP
jgi:tetratricopeptide (TPR) repeat protein